MIAQNVDQVGIFYQKLQYIFLKFPSLLNFLHYTYFIEKVAKSKMDFVQFRIHASVLQDGLEKIVINVKNIQDVRELVQNLGNVIVLRKRKLITINFV